MEDFYDDTLFQCLTKQLNELCKDTREHFILYLQLGATLVGEKKCFSLLVLLLHRIVIQGKRQNALEDLRQDSIIVGESLISHV